MKFFTSRYTASLEQQVAELKADKAKLEAQVGRLVNARADLIAMVGQSAKPAIVKAKQPVPHVGNWLRTRSQLETPDQVVQEIEEEN